MFRLPRIWMVLLLNLSMLGNALAQPADQERLRRIEEKLDRILALLEERKLGTGDFIEDQSCDQTRLDKEFFIICHDSHWRTARWVGYHLTAENLQGNQGRTNDFRPDPELPPDERSELSDYKGSGFDRGHMAPAGAFKRSREAMSTTFLLSNMAPQTTRLNRNIWRLLEQDVRTLAREFGEVWVFTGNLFLDDDDNPTEPTQRINNRVAVPTHCFKAILMKSNDGDLQTFAFIMPNIRGSIPGPVTAHLTTVDDVEAKSGSDFFAGLPDDIENQLESQQGNWPINGN